MYNGKPLWVETCHGSFSIATILMTAMTFFHLMSPLPFFTYWAELGMRIIVKEVLLNAPKSIFKHTKLFLVA